MHRESLSLKQSMVSLVGSNSLFWAVLGGILSLAGILLLVAPLEQTLGEGIRSVYLHVSLTWSGMLGLSASGLIGLVVVISGKRSLLEWTQSICWVALAMFAAGLVMSILAASINWGAVFWQEPRTQSALELLALGFIVQFVSYWAIPDRIKGLLYVTLVAFMTWTVSSTPRVLHPGSAAQTSPSLAIRCSFLSLFVLLSGAAAWIVIRKQTIKPPSITQE